MAGIVQASIAVLSNIVNVCGIQHGVVLFVFFFFFQAEDGIRDVAVTGVQTCALPILIYQRKMFLSRVASEPNRPCKRPKAHLLLSFERSLCGFDRKAQWKYARSMPIPRHAAWRTTRHLFLREARWRCGAAGTP